MGARADAPRPLLTDYMVDVFLCRREANPVVNVRAMKTRLRQRQRRIAGSVKPSTVN